MKKIILLGSVAFVALSMSSCKKEWTCTCTSSYSVNGVTSSASASATTEKMSKKDAEDACESGSVSTSYGSVKCEIE